MAEVAVSVNEPGARFQSTRIMSASRLASRAPAPLIHFTTRAGAAGIEASGQLLGRTGIFALPIQALGRSKLAHAVLTGIGPSKLASVVRIPARAAPAFHRVVPIGLYSALKASAGVRFAAPGVINMATGTFTQTGSILRPLAAIYATDVLSWGMVGAGLALAPTAEDGQE